MTWFDWVDKIGPTVGFILAAAGIIRTVTKGNNKADKETKELREYVVNKNEEIIERIHVNETDMAAQRASLAGHEKMTEALVNELRRQIEKSPKLDRDVPA